MRQNNEELDGRVSHSIAELERVEAARRQSEERFRALVLASSDVLYRMSPDWSEMCQLGGGGFLADTENPTNDWWRTYIPGEDQPDILRAIQQAVQTKSAFELEHRVWRVDGTLGWTLSRAVPILDAAGEIKEWFGAASDITARKQAEQALYDSLAEKEALLKEVHHRVKNNLQVITSLLEMHAHQADDPAAFALFNEARNRVSSIAAIHELLYRSGSFAKVELAPYARQLVPYLISFYRMESRIKVSISGDGAALDLERAVPFGLLLNELISNVCKHAFPGQTTGELAVRLSQGSEIIGLEVSDTGVGFSQGIDPLNSPSLGLQLVHLLTNQLAGRVHFRSSQGTSVEVCIPRALGGEPTPSRSRLG